MTTEISLVSPHTPRPPPLIHTCTQYTHPYPPHAHSPHVHVHSGPLVSFVSDRLDSSVLV
jgi:hypothetical protein